MGSMQDAIADDRKAVRRRLNSAVHQHRAISPKGVQERLFTWMFSGLVYPQIWEDPVVDLEAMAPAEGMHIVTIASGGCNMMSYLTQSKAQVTAVDLNRTHVALGKLKLAAAKHLDDYESWHRFFVLADERANIDIYRNRLRAHLDAQTAHYWDSPGEFGRARITLFTRGFYRFGLLGRFIGSAHVLSRAYGVRFEPLLQAKTLQEQQAFFDKELAPLFERPFVRWLTSKPSSLFGLGIPPSQYVSLTGGRHMSEVLKERLRKLVCDFPIGENYFAWQAFNRGYGRDEAAPLPPYLTRESFPRLTEIGERAEILNTSFTVYLRDQAAASCDRYVLLDAQDWMTDAQLNELWQEITRTARPGARVIFRTADEPSLLPGRLAPKVLAHWRYLDAQSAALTKKDRSSVYGGFHIYELAA